MNIRLAIFVTIIYAVLAGCDSGLGQSDMRGVFTTDHGKCVKEGDVGLTINDDHLTIGFYCFLVKCNEMEGPIEQGGHFYISDSSGHYIQGQLLSEKAKGSWFTTINSEKCSGTWFAVRNTQK